MIMLNIQIFSEKKLSRTINELHRFLTFSCHYATVDTSDPQSKLLLFSANPVYLGTPSLQLPRVKIQATVTKHFACVVTVTGHVLFPFFAETSVFAWLVFRSLLSFNLIEKRLSFRGSNILTTENISQTKILSFVTHDEVVLWIWIRKKTKSSCNWRRSRLLKR